MRRRADADGLVPHVGDTRNVSVFVDTVPSAEVAVNAGQAVTHACAAATMPAPDCASGHVDTSSVTYA